MSETGFLQLCNFFSQDATFTKVYNSTPHVFVSANHSTKNGSQSPIHNSIAEWVEVCFISLFTCLFFPFFMNFGNIPLATTVTCEDTNDYNKHSLSLSRPVEHNSL